MRAHLFQFLAALAAISVPVNAVSAWQSAHWAEGFESPALFTSCGGLTVHDDGNGPELYVAGQAIAYPYNRQARYDGTTWRFISPLIVAGSVLPVTGMVSFDPGSGSHLYALGNSELLVKAAGGWTSTGTVFHPFASGYPQFSNATLVYDDGSGPALYAAGAFGSVDGTSALNVARWDGTNWSALGPGVSGIAELMTVFDDGNGPALVVSGNATPGSNTGFVSLWRNGTWTALPGLGVGHINAIQAYDDGSGPALYVGGQFELNGSATRLARWNGTSWTDIGSPGEVTALAVHDDGGGPALFAAHWTTLPTTYHLAALRRLRAGTWTTLLFPPGSRTLSMTTFQGRLWIAGEMDWSRPEGVSCLESWDGSQFESTFRGNGLIGQARGAGVADIGNGPKLYASGFFQRAGHVAASNIAVFDGTSWSSMGAGLSAPSALAFRAFDDGTGTKLYVGGTFTNPGGLIARWDGTSWSQVGGGILNGTGEVSALQPFDDGSGLQLYAGGGFSHASGQLVNNVTRWNGTSWSPVGTGLGFYNPNAIGTVAALVVHDDGSGPRLYAGGSFTQAGSTPVIGVARWDGTSWSQVGAGIAGHSFYQGVYALCVHDDGSGVKLYAAGWFQSLPNVARWDGVGWSSVGNGLPGPVLALCVYDDGAGPKLYASISESNSTQGGLFRWDGVAWTAVAGAPDTGSGNISAIVSYDDPSADPPALYVFGQFAGNEVPSTNVAKWSTVTEDVVVCPGDGSGAACPCGNASTVTQAGGCLNSLGLAGTLRTSGSASVSNDTLVLLGTSMPGTSAALYFQGTRALGLGDGVVFGDGLRCAGGSVRRLGTTVNAGGASVLPNSSQPTALSLVGSIPVGGTTRVYQAWYRNAAAFCTSATWNLTNGVRITWRL